MALQGGWASCDRNRHGQQRRLIVYTGTETDYHADMLIDVIGHWVGSSPWALFLMQTQTSRAPQRPYGWVTIVIAIVMVLAIVIVSCSNPRRSHRD